MNIIEPSKRMASWQSAKKHSEISLCIDTPTQRLETEVVSCDDPSFAFTIY